MRKIRNLNSIQVFNEVSRLKNNTLSAKALHISQSSVSYHIKKLEDELNASLFQSSRAGLILTSNGGKPCNTRVKRFAFNPDWTRQSLGSN